jgi:hypothetical protein
MATNGSTFVVWQPTPQIAWIKQNNNGSLLCQFWVEGFNGPTGFQQTGNAQWREVPTIDMSVPPDSDETSDGGPRSGLLI